jgi:putative proteasome-type protease
MTYCVAIKLNAGLVFLSDSRTNAGLDQISSFRKMMVYEKTGDRFMVLLSAGNLSISQSVREILQNEQIKDGESGEAITIWNAKSMFEAARVLGAAVRHVHERDGAALKRSGVDFNVSMVFGGQIKGEGMRLFQVYSAGNFIEATTETPYFQVGESKYGKPVLDRVLTPETPLDEAAKCALVSMDSTLKSNLSVGLPLDLVVYEADRFSTDKIICIDEHNPYFRMLHDSWGQKLREVFDSIEDPTWDGSPTDVPLMCHSARSLPLKKISNEQEKLI